MDIVRYRRDGEVAVIEMDDGKRNALSPTMLRGLHDAFERAARERAPVVLTGRGDIFSAGFDLKVMRSGGLDALRMLRLGFTLPARIATHPRPVVAACSGHVLAMGLFAALSCDHVVGARGDFKVAANEVAIGITMPRVAVALLEHRLTPAAFQRAVTLSHFFSADEALEAGVFDSLAEPADVLARALEVARASTALDMRAHAASKRRIRRGLLRRLRRGVPLDLADAALLGLRAVARR
ncbi:MAG: crotonase/enoyl-CoA hydratase family protein [Myxococcota bacterium]|nr:crotonase/enoyl-CoA hydratase family protein [Myxococcota bacterium]